jgi:hypothetical protein
MYPLGDNLRYFTTTRGITLDHLHCMHRILHHPLFPGLLYFVAATKIFKEKISYRVIGSGIATCLSAVFIILYLSALSNSPLAFGVIWFLLWLSFFFQSFMVL